MAWTFEDALRALEEVAEQAPSIRIELDAEYLRAIALVEALPHNQSGADKTWVWRLDKGFRDHYKRVRRG